MNIVHKMQNMNLIKEFNAVLLVLKLCELKFTLDKNNKFLDIGILFISALHAVKG